MALSVRLPSKATERCSSEGFTEVKGTSRNFVARLNADGTLDTGFQNGLGGADGTINSVALQSDGKVLIAGEFSTINGVVRHHIARLNLDGSLDTSLQAAANDTINSLVVQSNGQVLIGGAFTNINGLPISGVARLNPDGTLDRSFISGLSVNALPGFGIRSVAVQSDGKVLIDGSTTPSGIVGPGSIARLNT